MQIIIRETSEAKTLSLLNKGTECTEDFISLTDAFEEHFEWSNSAWVCDEETYIWWSEVLKEHQGLI